MFREIELIWKQIYWTLDISRTASYETTLARLSVRPSLSFLKVGSLLFSDIVHDDSWPWYLVTDKAIFKKKKKNWRPGYGANRSKSDPKLGFLPFLNCSLLVFLEITYNDTLQQCLTSSIGKIHEKIFWGPKY